MGVQQMEEQKIKEGLSIWLECRKIRWERHSGGKQHEDNTYEWCAQGVVPEIIPVYLYAHEYCQPSEQFQVSATSQDL